MAWQFAIGNREFLLVYQLISQDMGIISRIYSFWANSAGSLFIWFWFLTIIQFFIEYISDELKTDLPAIIISSFSSSILIGLLFEQPFEMISAPQDFTEGLLPSLRSSYTAYHPFFSFGAYSLALLMYAVTISDSDVSISNKKWLYKVNMLIIALLGSSIVSGAFWSNEVLWGGLWTWDPVENLTLLIFLVALLPIHLRSYPKRIQLLAMKFLFPTIMYATVVIRSGLLKGPHSYARTSQILFYIGIFLVSLLPIVKELKIPEDFTLDINLSFQGRDLWLIANLVMIAIITITTSMLMLISINSIEKPTTPVLFYQLMILPLLVIPLMITVISELKDFVKSSLPYIVIISLLIMGTTLATIILIKSITAEIIFLYTIFSLPILLVLLKPKSTDINYNFTLRRLGRILIHSSLFLLLLSFCFTHASTTYQDFQLRSGEEHHGLGHRISIQSIDYQSNLGDQIMPWDYPRNLTWEITIQALLDNAEVELTAGWNPVHLFYTIPTTIQSFMITTQMILKFDGFATFDMDQNDSIILNLQIRDMLDGYLFRVFELQFPIFCIAVIILMGRATEPIDDYYK